MDIEESFEDEESDKRKKWMLWGGIGAGVIVLGIVIWAIWGRPKNIEPNAAVYDSTELFISDEEGCGGGDEDMDYVMDEEEIECIDTAPYEEPVMEEEQSGGGIVMSGYINGKYEAKMKFTEYPDGTVSGDYRYVKYNSPIVITGRYTDMGDYHEISLDEKVDGKVVGSFKGNYDGNVFSGTWVKADGSQEMPFRFER